MSYREDGIQALIDLQAFAGITETREDAEAGWDNMTRADQAQTMIAHGIVCDDQGASQ